MTRYVWKPKICCVLKVFPTCFAERLSPQRCENDAKTEPPLRPEIFSRSKNRLSSMLLGAVAPCARPPPGFPARSVTRITLGVMPDSSNFDLRPPQSPKRGSLGSTSSNTRAVGSLKVSLFVLFVSCGAEVARLAPGTFDCPSDAAAATAPRGVSVAVGAGCAFAMPLNKRIDSSKIRIAIEISCQRHERVRAIQVFTPRITRPGRGPRIPLDQHRGWNRGQAPGCGWRASQTCTDSKRARPAFSHTVTPRASICCRKEDCERTSSTTSRTRASSRA